MPANLNAMMLPPEVREDPKGSNLGRGAVQDQDQSIHPRSQTPVVEVPKQDTDNIFYFGRIYCLQTLNSVSNCPSPSNRNGAGYLFSYQLGLTLAYFA